MENKEKYTAFLKSKNVEIYATEQEEDSFVFHVSKHDQVRIQKEYKALEAEMNQETAI